MIGVDDRTNILHIIRTKPRYISYWSLTSSMHLMIFANFVFPYFLSLWWICFAIYFLGFAELQFFIPFARWILWQFVMTADWLSRLTWYLPHVESRGMHPIPLMRSNNNISRLTSKNNDDHDLWTERIVEKLFNWIVGVIDTTTPTHQKMAGNHPKKLTDYPQDVCPPERQHGMLHLKVFFGNGWTRLLIIVRSICELQVRKYSVDSTVTSCETSQFWKPNVHRW